MIGIEGMGDVVALAAKPAARLIDHLFGTDLVNCPSCEERRQDWNAAIPFNDPKMVRESGFEPEFPASQAGDLSD